MSDQQMLLHAWSSKVQTISSYIDRAQAQGHHVDIPSICQSAGWNTQRYYSAKAYMDSAKELMNNDKLSMEHRSRLHSMMMDSTTRTEIWMSYIDKCRSLLNLPNVTSMVESSLNKKSSRDIMNRNNSINSMMGSVGSMPPQSSISQSPIDDTTRYNQFLQSLSEIRFHSCVAIDDLLLPPNSNQTTRQVQLPNLEMFGIDELSSASKHAIEQIAKARATSSLHANRPGNAVLPGEDPFAPAPPMKRTRNASDPVPITMFNAPISSRGGPANPSATANHPGSSHPSMMRFPSSSGTSMPMQMSSLRPPSLSTGMRPNTNLAATTSSMYPSLNVGSSSAGLVAPNSASSTTVPSPFSMFGMNPHQQHHLLAAAVAGTPTPLHPSSLGGQPMNRVHHPHHSFVQAQQQHVLDPRTAAAAAAAAASLSFHQQHNR